VQQPGQAKLLTIKIVGSSGEWQVRHAIQTQREDYAAEIWVEPGALGVSSS
jgi:hypothetical protein